MTDPVTELAQKAFSVPFLFPIQRYTIANILDGIHQIVILPTGSGKSLCFQLPAIILPGVTFIIVPLLSLMADQVRRFREKGIKCDSIKGGQTEEERTAILGQIKAGGLKILFVTPESLTSSKLEDFFAQIDIEHLVIDEAHCVTEWGNTFRPAYLEIGNFIRAREIKRVTAFTATASENVIKQIKAKVFGDLPVATLIENPDRTNIRYEVIPVLAKARAIARLVSVKASPMLIFVRSRKRAEYYARLIRNRLPAKDAYFYHAGLDKEERQVVEDWFMQTDNGVLVATAAFGLGIDKLNVRSVIHAEVPYSVEAYLQESGRAGRDREPGEAVLLYSPEDLRFAEKLVDDVQQSRYKNLLKYTQTGDVCRREVLLACMGYTLETGCSGCDVCDGKAVVEAGGQEALLDFFRKYKRRFTRREAIQVLQGKQTYDVVTKELDRFLEFGGLASWEDEDLGEGIDCLVGEGWLKIPEKGAWKYRITIGANHPDEG